MSMPQWVKENRVLSVLIGIAMVISAMGGAAAAFDDIRWWVSRAEFQDRIAVVDRALRENKTGQIKINLNVLRGQLWTVQKEIRELKAKSQAIPNSLYREEQRLQAEIRSLERELFNR